MTREEAIEVYHGLLNQKIKEAFEVFAPELKESEDERIRKWLYDYISNCPNNNFEFYGGVGKDAVLNYLEKQKESLRDFIDDFPYSAEKEERDYRKVYEDIAKSDLKKAYVGKSLGEEFEQKEQKPLEYLPKEKVYDIIDKLTDLSYSKLIPFKSRESQKIDEISSDILGLLDYPIEKKREQKPEWSEEDEKIRKELINWLNGKTTYEWTYEWCENKDRWITYLEKRKEQKPVEWGEDIARRVPKKKLV